MATKDGPPDGYIEIYEKPALRRIRYASEGRSTSEKSYPVKPVKPIGCCTTQATVLVPCVTVNEPYR